MSHMTPFPFPNDPPISPTGPRPDPVHLQPQSLPEHCLRPGFTHLPHQWLGDPESLYRSFARVAPIRDFRSLVPESHFYQWAGLLDLGDVVLASYASSNVRFTIDDAPAVHLVSCFAGYRRVTTPAGEVHTTPGGVALLPVGQRQAWGSHSAAIVTIKPQQISRVAVAMAGERAARMVSPRRSGAFSPQQLGDGPQSQMVTALLRSLDACAAVHPQLPAKLCVGDSLCRVAAVLLYPELLHESPGDLQRWQERDGRSAFDNLLDYIRAHLDQPLRLSELEARSNYSSRALQYAFRQRLGCTPKEWIRQQRLGVCCP